MNRMLFTTSPACLHKGLVLCIFFFSLSSFAGDLPQFIFKEGDKKPFAGFELYNGNFPCKTNNPCLFIHKDSDSLRLILEGKKIRMAYKSNDTEQMPFPNRFRARSPQEKAEIASSYRDFFKSEFALMLQAFIYTVPGLFDWEVDLWKTFGNKNIISENELHKIFNTGIKPQYYTILKTRCVGGETVIFESDGNGNFFMEVK